MSAPRNAWRLREPTESPLGSMSGPQPRPITVDGTWNYIDPWSSEPGGEVALRVAAPAAYHVAVRKLALRAFLDPDVDAAGDDEEAGDLVAGEFARAAPQVITPGSFGYTTGPVVAPKAISTWLRLWRLTTAEHEWEWSAILSAFDFPRQCGWALFIDYVGRLGIYAGDGGVFHYVNIHTARGVHLGDHLERWLHVAAVRWPERVELFIDGTVVLSEAAESPSPPAAPIRLAASGEQGVAERLLDADIGPTALFGEPLDRRVVRSLAEHPASSPLDTCRAKCVAYWPMWASPRGVLADQTGNGHDLHVVNQPSLNIAGPATAPGTGTADRPPAFDSPGGSAVRFSSDDLTDCGWRAAGIIEIPADAESGLYAAEVTLAGAERGVGVPFVVSRRVPRQQGAAALLIPTFTWAAYGRRPHDECVVPGLASSFYTEHLNGTMHFHVGTRMPLPRLPVRRSESHRPRETLHQHLVFPERLACDWLSREGYAYECISDFDLHEEPGLLVRFATLIIVGHSEYWSSEMRDGVRSYLDAGGTVTCMSGNTLYWRVSLDPDTMALEARKTSHVGEADDWLPPAAWKDRWHDDGTPGGSWALLERPAADILGLEFAGYIDKGDASSFAPFRVLEPDHFLFHSPETVGVTSGQLFGTRCINGPAICGYEVDCIPEAVGLDADTRGRVVLAHSVQRQFESFTEVPDYGADMIYWDRPSGGRVFDAGTIAYSGSLAVDPYVQALTRNVLHAFGVHRAPRNRDPAT